MTTQRPAIPDGMRGPYLGTPKPETLISHLLEKVSNVALFEHDHGSLAQRMAGRNIAWQAKGHTLLPGSSVPVRAVYALTQGVDITEHMPVARLATVAALGQLLRDLREAPQYVTPDDADLLAEAEATFMQNCRPCPREAERAEEKARLYEALAHMIEALA